MDLLSDTLLPAKGVRTIRKPVSCCYAKSYTELVLNRTCQLWVSNRVQPLEIGGLESAFCDCSALKCDLNSSFCVLSWLTRALRYDATHHITARARGPIMATGAPM